MFKIKKIFEGKSIPLLPIKTDMSGDLNQEAVEVINAAIDSNMKTDEETA